ncbi:MAG: hypothetical protein HYW25_00050 [Candidatus Aenigmarchaeota archaeon]|nr:hypothetical protein [Candidatus Aenigmarchaeota archaeon]
MTEWAKRGEYEAFLLDTECVGFFDPPITLKSGRPGHWYVNMRKALGNRNTRDELARFVYDFVVVGLGLKPDHFLGVPDGATPLGEACTNLIDYRDVGETPAAILRSGVKSHGDPADRYSVGPLKHGGHVVLVEDVTTTGGSSMEHILRLQEVGVHIDRLVSCVSRYERRDRGRTVEDVLKRDYTVEYAALTDARAILPRAVERFNPDEALVKAIEDYYRTYGIKPIKLLEAANQTP